jgi:hypothetical protein
MLHLSVLEVSPAAVLAVQRVVVADIGPDFLKEGV